jgi:adenylosuccinate synthase
MRAEKRALLLTDLGFGDAGKGTITDFLARRSGACTIVRYNGGPQAAHNVVDATGRHHTFAQFGSGMFVPGTRTLLSRFMLINPFNMLKEARHLEAKGVLDPLQRVLIDRRALVITPFQRSVCRLRELARGGKRHGSCGEGVGECMADDLADSSMSLHVGDLNDEVTLLAKLRLLREAKLRDYASLAPLLPATEAVSQECRVLNDPTCLTDCAQVYAFFARQVAIVDEVCIRSLFAQPGTLLFEGAQGVLLDENYGFAPYTTWSTTTLANAQTLLAEHDYAGQVIRLGIMRTYMTRHGAGPLPTEEPALATYLPERYNTWNDWQHAFRVGPCDLVLARYAREVVGELDGLAVTHLDRLAELPTWRVCTSYLYQGAEQDLSPYVQQSGNRVTALRVQRPPDLQRQEQLTQLLQQCAPVYEVISRRAAGDPAPYLELLAQHLNTPIALLSSGPAADEKVVCTQRVCLC